MCNKPHWVRMEAVAGSGLTCYTVVLGHRHHLELLATAARSAAFALWRRQKEGSMSTDFLGLSGDAQWTLGQVGHGEDDGDALRAARGRRHADLKTSTLPSQGGGNLEGEEPPSDREGPPMDQMAPSS